MNAIAQLLERTSRTFALSIPFLPDELQRSVTIAYLLFRIADTIEDELDADTGVRADALRLIADSFESDSSILDETLGVLRTVTEEPAHDGYASLMASAPLVLSEYQDLNPEARHHIATHLARTARGMADFLGRDLSEGTADDLRAYCYTVAGIVGEMLTQLFAAGDPRVAPIRDDLLADAAAFGEALQLVNIIRDANTDLSAGRRYLPRSIDRASLITMARDSLTGAARYTRSLEEAGANSGIVAFNTLNAALASRTLRAIEASGPGAKMSRSEVAGVAQRIRLRVESGSSMAHEIEPEPSREASRSR